MTNPADNKSKISGEGNYEAAKRFDDAEQAFVTKRGKDIPALAKQAAQELDGPKGAELRKAAEVAAKGKTARKSEG